MSPFHYKALSAVAAIMMSSAASATIYSVTGYPDEDCSTTGFYDDFSTQEDANSCTSIAYGSSEFNLTNNNYQIYWKLNDSLDDGCEVALLGQPSSGSVRDCGECLGRISNTGGCTRIPVPENFYVTWCCGTECNDYCGAPGKRSLPDNWSDPVKAERSAPLIANPAKVKSMPLLEKRKDCSFKKNGDVYDSAGTPVQVSNTINTCPSEEGCDVDYEGTVEQSFSQTFGVSETTEAGLFDIISVSVTFSYEQTWEESKSVSTKGSFKVPQGEGGYITFSPLSQCIKGTFSGSECSDDVEVDKEGTACVPETINDGKMPKGDLNLVISG